MTVIDTVFKALAAAIPTVDRGWHHAILCVSLVHGHRPRTRKVLLAHMGPRAAAGARNFPRTGVGPGLHQ